MKHRKTKEYIVYIHKTIAKGEIRVKAKSKTMAKTKAMQLLKSGIMKYENIRELDFNYVYVVYEMNGEKRGK